MAASVALTKRFIRNNEAGLTVNLFLKRSWREMSGERGAFLEPPVNKKEEVTLAPLAASGLELKVAWPDSIKHLRCPDNPSDIRRRESQTLKFITSRGLLRSAACLITPVIYGPDVLCGYTQPGDSIILGDG